MPPKAHNVQVPGAPASPVGKPQPGAVELAGIGGAGVTIALGNREVLLDDVVRGAFDSSGMNAAEWNAMDPSERDSLIATQRNEMQAMFSRHVVIPDQATAQAQARAAVEQRRAAHASQKTVSVASAEKGLPHPNDLDPDKIAAPVLTTHGWMAPNPKGLPPNQLR